MLNVTLFGGCLFVLVKSTKRTFVDTAGADDGGPEDAAKDLAFDEMAEEADAPMCYLKYKLDRACLRFPGKAQGSLPLDPHRTCTIRTSTTDDVVPS